MTNKVISNTLIYTSLSKERLGYLLDWIISLRTLGNYTGEVLVLYYGNDVNLAEIAGFYNFRLVQYNKKFNVNDRFVDILPVLDEDYRSFFIAHFDIDIWFQSDVNELFEQVANMDGVLFSLEALRPFNQDKRIAGEETDDRIREHSLYVQKFQMEHHGVINGGFFAGHYPILKKKLEAFNETYKIYKPYGWNCDQFILNVLFDPGADGIDRRWNSVIRDTHLSNGRYCMKKISIRMENDRLQRDEYPSDIEVKGVHCNKNPHHRKIHFRFRFIYAGLFLRHFRKEILANPVYSDMWPMTIPTATDPDIWLSLPKPARTHLAKGKRQKVVKGFAKKKK